MDSKNIGNKIENRENTLGYSQENMLEQILVCHRKIDIYQSIIIWRFCQLFD